MSFFTRLVQRIRQYRPGQPLNPPQLKAQPYQPQPVTARAPRFTATTPKKAYKTNRRQVNRNNRARKAHTCGIGKGRIKIFY